MVYGFVVSIFMPFIGALQFFYIIFNIKNNKIIHC